MRHTAEQACWVALPAALIARLLQAQAPLPLVLELRPAAPPGAAPGLLALTALSALQFLAPPLLACAGSLAEPHGDASVWHVAWAGAAASGQALEVPAALARRQGLAEGARVSVRALPDTPAAQAVCVEPDSTDDWEQLELNAGYIEEQLLNQARAACLTALGALAWPWELCIATEHQLTAGLSSVQPRSAGFQTLLPTGDADGGLRVDMPRIVCAHRWAWCVRGRRSRCGCAAHSCSCASPAQRLRRSSAWCAAPSWQSRRAHATALPAAASSNATGMALLRRTGRWMQPPTQTRRTSGCVRW